MTKLKVTLKRRRFDDIRIQEQQQTLAKLALLLILPYTAVNGVITEKENRI
jgi:hypothetical protein